MRRAVFPRCARLWEANAVAVLTTSTTKKHLLVEGATGKGGFVVGATGADGQDTAPSSEETRLRAQVRRTRSFLRQRRSGSDAHSASRTSAFVCVCLLPRCPHLLIHFTFHGDALRRMNEKK